MKELEYMKIANIYGKYFKVNFCFSNSKMRYDFLSTILSNIAACWQPVLDEHHTFELSNLQLYTMQSINTKTSPVVSLLRCCPDWISTLPIGVTKYERKLFHAVFGAAFCFKYFAYLQLVWKHVKIRLWFFYNKNSLTFSCYCYIGETVCAS